jgi:hypothetical protein
MSSLLYKELDIFSLHLWMHILVNTFFPVLIFVDHVTFVYINKCEVIKYMLVSIICEILFLMAFLKNIFMSCKGYGWLSW